MGDKLRQVGLVLTVAVIMAAAAVVAVSIANGAPAREGSISNYGWAGLILAASVWGCVNVVESWPTPRGEVDPIADVVEAVTDGEIDAEEGERLIRAIHDVRREMR